MTVRAYIMPAAVFQSVMVGGGYGTGREIVEYFSRYGMVGGLLGLALVTVCFAVLLAVSYEFARVFRVYDYRRFFRELLGKGWIAFEVLYLTMFALVLAVVAAASGTLFEEQLHVPGVFGIGALLLLVTLVAFYGRTWVTRVLAFKAALLCIVFVAYFVIVVGSSGEQIAIQLDRGEVGEGWASGALRYVLYSSVVIPAMLFATTSIQTRAQAIASGIVSAVAGTVPAVLVHISFAPGYPEVLGQPVPMYWMIAALGLPLLTAAYLLVLFASLVDTGLCFIQSVNERIDGWSLERRARPLSGLARAGTAIACVLVSGSLSFVGIVSLIARGYGAMAWGFLVLFVAPLLTIGLHKLVSRHRACATTALPDGHG